MKPTKSHLFTAVAAAALGAGAGKLTTSDGKAELQSIVQHFRQADERFLRSHAPNCETDIRTNGSPLNLLTAKDDEFVGQRLLEKLRAEKQRLDSLSERK